MRKLKKIVGALLIAWAAIRWIPDSLESIQATEKYAKWLHDHSGYLHILYVHDVLLSSTCIVVGIGLIFSDTIQKELQKWRRKELEPELYDWHALAGRFDHLEKRPVPAWAEWIENLTTKEYQWTIRSAPEVTTRLCIELCKEGGRQLSQLGRLSSRFPEIARIGDEGDRWLFAVRQVAGLGKVRAETRTIEHGALRISECGEIGDVCGASRVLCQILLNDFTR